MAPGPQKTSVVWNYFNKVINGKEASCNICQKNLKYFGGTTNLRQHLLRIHPDLELDASACEIIYTINQPESSEPTPCSSGSSSKSFKTKIFTESSKQLKQKTLSDSKIAQINSHLVRMIVKDYQPLSVVEDVGFLEYIHALEPLYTPPNRNELATEILPKYYEEAASGLQLVLNEINNLALTIDIWTSVSTKSYLTVTCHFIENDKFEARVLATNQIVGSHTAENIAEELNKISTQWNISHKIVTIVSNNETNIKKAINECVQKHHHPCIAHALHLSVTEAITSVETFDAILQKCRALVDYFKQNLVASEKLKSVQEEMNTLPLKVKQEVSTRWNSTFIMIERLLLIKEPLFIAVADLPNPPEFLDDEEWIILEGCVQVLQPAYDLTSVLSSEKYPTLSIVIPLIRGFQFAVKNIKTQNRVAEELRKKILDTFTRRLVGFEINKIAAKACFLDPRFKKYGFGSEDNANMAQKLITEELIYLISLKEEVSRNLEISTVEDEPCDQPKLESIWAHFDKKLSSFKTFSSPTTLVTLMISQYLEMPPLERNRCPLEFWAQHKHMLPEMYTLAMKYLCIPCTSLPSERFFSKTGQLINDRRSRLCPRNLNSIVFLNSCT